MTTHIQGGGIPVNDSLTHYGIKGMKWGVRKAVKQSEDNYRSDVKGAKVAYKAGKKTASNRQEKRANKLAYSRSLGKAADKYNSSIEKIAKKEGARLTEKSKGSTTAAIVKGYAKATAGSLAMIGGFSVAQASNNPAGIIGAYVAALVLGGALMDKGLNDISSVSAYEGDTSMLKRKTAYGQNY